MTESRVGIRELRQYLSVYLRRVQAGESFEVTDRGSAVALLVPLPEPDSPLARLVASGRATRPAAGPDTLKGPARKPTTELSRAIEQEREEKG